MDKEKLSRHWRASRALLWKVLAAWFVFAYLIHFFVAGLNEISLLGFPLGYYAAAQGSLLAFVVIIFLFARAQEKIDAEHGLSEDDNNTEAK